MKTYETIDVYSDFELVRVVDVATDKIIDHAISMTLATRGRFRLVKLMDTSFGHIMEYLILAADGTPVSVFSAEDERAARLAFSRRTGITFPPQARPLETARRHPLLAG